MKATEQYFPVMLFIMLCKVVLTFESVDEILKCDHSNESYWAVLSCSAVCFAIFYRIKCGIFFNDVILGTFWSGEGVLLLYCLVLSYPQLPYLCWSRKSSDFSFYLVLGRIRGILDCISVDQSYLSISIQWPPLMFAELLRLPVADQWRRR